MDRGRYAAPHRLVQVKLQSVAMVMILLLCLLATIGCDGTSATAASLHRYLQTSGASTAAQQYTLGETLFPYAGQKKPRKGEGYTDPLYHLRVTRITDTEHDDPTIKAGPNRRDNCGYGIGSGYPTWNPLNSDRTRLMLYGIANDCANLSWGYLIYDAVSGVLKIDLAPSNQRSPLLWWNNNDPEPRWDRTGTHPYRLYYRKNMQLRYFDTDTFTDGLTHDFAKDFPQFTPETDGGAGQERYYVLNHEYGSPSMDSRYWAFYIERYNGTNSSQEAIFVYDMLEGRVRSQKILPAGAALKGVLMSPKGDYVMVNYWDHYASAANTGEFDGPHVYDRDFGRSVQITKTIPHSNWAYDAQGNLVVFMLNEDFLMFTRVDTGDKYYVYPQARLGWMGSNSLTAFQKQYGWAFFSTYGCDAVDYTNCTPENQSAYWAYNQIFAMELDESKYLFKNGVPAPKGTPTPRIWRIAFTQNYVDRNYYLQQPNAQMDYEGTTIWWGANWRMAEGVHEVYRLDLPPMWHSDLGRGESPKKQ